MKRQFTALPEPHRDDGLTAEAGSKRGSFDITDALLAVGALLLSSLCGALLAIYWPFAPVNPESGLNDRLSTLETKVDEIAAGRSSKAAILAFTDARRELSYLKDRLDADEARLAAFEKSQAETGDADFAALRSGANKTALEVRHLSDRFARLTTAAADTASISQLRGELDERSRALHEALSRFDERLAALEKSAPPADLAQHLNEFALRSDENALEMRILRLESQNMTAVMRRAAAVMALADLVRLSASGEPFAEELSSLKSLAPASPELDDLSRYAVKGVPTQTMLAESLSRHAESILAAEHASDTTRTLSDRIWSGVMSIVPTRRIGTMVRNDSDARVARAQNDLSLGELSRAVREMNALQGPARDAAAPWLKSANERLSVDRDARTLTQKLVSDLSSMPASAATGTAAK